MKQWKEGLILSLPLAFSVLLSLSNERKKNLFQKQLLFLFFCLNWYLLILAMPDTGKPELGMTPFIIHCFILLGEGYTPYV